MWLSYLLIGSVRALLGATPRWIGSKPEDRQRIYFANHTSHIDTVAIWSALPPDLRAKTRTAAAADYWGTSTLKRAIAIKALNAVLIDRKRADPQADPCGRSMMCLRPANRSSFSGRNARPGAASGAFQVGPLLLGATLSRGRAHSGLSGQPACSMPKGTLLPVPLICTVRFGAPLPGIAGEDKSVFLERARNAVTELAE